MSAINGAISRPGPLTPAQNAYQYTIETMVKALSALKAQADGPATENEADKQSLLAAHLPALREYGRALTEFTEAGQALSTEEQALFQEHIYKQVHPLMLQSPFARRCFEKPLGYAGDYVMVRYILNDPFQGDSAFAQLMNFALVQADVAEGHRNRIVFLEALLSRHAAKAHANGCKATGLTIGCGPAEETYRFIKNSPHADSLDLTLMDFSEETLNWTAAHLAEASEVTGRQPNLHYLHESVYNLAKVRPETVLPTYDFVVCAGLFDYLSDRFCERVIEYGMRSLQPGGTLLVTNVSKCSSSYGMSKLLEWDLIYRSAEQLEALLPRREGFVHKVYVDETGTNVFAEVTKVA